MTIVTARLAAALQAAPPVVVVFETTVGTFEVAVDTAHAPRTAANFLKYVDDRGYNDGYFHRAVRPTTETRSDYPIQVVQASAASSDFFICVTDTPENDSGGRRRASIRASRSRRRTA